MPGKISQAATIVAVKDQVSCDLGDEAVILHCSGGIYYGLNPVGATVWRALTKPKTLCELRELVLQEYEVSPEQCSQDLDKLLDDLARAGLVEIHDTSSNP